MLVLRVNQAAKVPETGVLRWFDGARAWQADVRLERVADTRVRCVVEQADEWEGASTRGSLRAPAHATQVVARVVTSTRLAGGRRMHAECINLSETGCLAAWTGPPPGVGDAIDLTWDSGGQRTAVEVGWVAARVVRTSRLRSGQTAVAFRFNVSNAAQAARIRAWHRDWLRRATRHGL